MIHNASYPSAAYCTAVRQNAPHLQFLDIVRNIGVETNVDAICGIAIHPANLTF